MTILRLLAVLSVILVTCGWGTAQTNIISFGLPFVATQSDPCPRYPQGLCLADSLLQCDEVALISSKGVCRATTSYRFRYEVPGGSEFEATLLEGFKECLELPNVAVLGVRIEAVRVVGLKEDKSPVPSGLETKAREFLKDYVLPEGVELASPRLVKPLESKPGGMTDAVALITFGFAVENRSVAGNGPSILSSKDTVIRLDGNCTWGPLFFALDGELHRAYTASHCCDCGERILYVYNVSGPTPKKVYENGKLSD